MRKLILLLILLLSSDKAAASPNERLVCIEDAVIRHCYSATLMTGWWLCADHPPSPFGALSNGFERKGRFIAFDSNPVCGPIGCARLNGRFKRIYVENGSSLRSILVIDDEPHDGFEHMDQFATSSCSFNRFITGGQRDEMDLGADH